MARCCGLQARAATHASSARACASSVPVGQQPLNSRAGPYAHGRAATKQTGPEQVRQWPQVVGQVPAHGGQVARLGLQPLQLLVLAPVRVLNQHLVVLGMAPSNLDGVAQ